MAWPAAPGAARAASASTASAAGAIAMATRTADFTMPPSGVLLLDHCGQDRATSRGSCGAPGCPATPPLRDPVAARDQEGQHRKEQPEHDAREDEDEGPGVPRLGP